jgi:pimeloyl-ACP methyl ester carboxylesterase
MPIEERWVEVDGYKVWSKRIGALNGNDRYPVVLLHGGPGVPSDYLEPLERLAESGREVIVYDQLGCGRSDHPDDPALLPLGAGCPIANGEISDLGSRCPLLRDPSGLPGRSHRLVRALSPFSVALR